MKFFMPCIAALFLASASFSQNCSGYYYLSNSSVVMTTYDKKANESGKVTYTISDIKKTGDAITANFASEMVDEKGKSISTGSGKYKCSGGNLFIDARTSMPQEQMGAYKDMDVKADEVFIEYPSSFFQRTIP